MPIDQLITLIRVEVQVNRIRLVKLPGLNVARQLYHLLDRIGLEQILIIQMVEQDVEALLRVHNVRTVVRGHFGLDALDFRVQEFVDRTRGVGDVGSVAGRC
jgi:hypothetical protein